MFNSPHARTSNFVRCEATMRQKGNEGSAKISVVGKPKGTEKQCGNRATKSVGAMKLCSLHRKIVDKESQGER